MHHNTRLTKDVRRHERKQAICIDRVNQLTQVPVLVVTEQCVSFRGEEELPELRGFASVSKRVHPLRVREIQHREETKEDLT